MARTLSAENTRRLRTVSLLDDVRAAAEQLQKVEDERLEARKRLRAAIVAAYSEGIPVARIAREAGISRPTLYRYLEAD
jgi:DNA-binding phage protein